MKKLIVAALMAAFTGSCALVVAGSAGAGAYAWSHGELSRNYRQPLATAWEGTKHALNVSRLTVQKQTVDDHYGKITASTADKEESVTINLEKWTSGETRVSVRVGVIGDRDRSEKIHEEIEKALR